MQYRILLFALVFKTVFVFGQSSSSIQLGTMVRQTMKESWADARPISYQENGAFYMLVPYTEIIAGPVMGNSSYIVGFVSNEGNLEKTNMLKLEIGGEELKYEFTKEIGNEILIFGTLKDKKTKNVSFYTFTLDKSTLELKTPKKILDLSFDEFKRQFERATFRVELSSDKSKLLISYSLLNKENSILGFGYVVLNTELKKIGQWLGNLNMTDGIYQFDQFRISNKGEVYLITRFYGNEKAYDKSASMKKSNLLSGTRSMEIRNNYEHRIAKFQSDGSTKIIPIPNTTHFNVTLDMEVTPTGDLILIGFSSNNDTNQPNAAVCLIVNANNGKVTETGYKEFGDTFKMPSDINNKNNGLSAGEEQYHNYRFILSDIKFNKNKGYTLIGERNVLQSKKVSGGYITVNHLDDLAVIDVNSKGVINAVYKIEKSQQVTGLDIIESSYYYFELKNQKHFIFTNMGKRSTDETIISTIGTDGKISSKNLLTKDETEIVVSPKSVKMFDNILFLYGKKSNRYCRWATQTL